MADEEVKQGEGDKAGEKESAIDLSGYVPKDEFEKLSEELERFRVKHREAEKHLKAKEAEAKAAALEAAHKSGDIEAVKKSLTESYAEERRVLDEKISRKDIIIKKKVADAAAWKVAADVGVDEKAAKAIHKLVRDMFGVEFTDDDDAVAVIIDGTGNKSSMTAEDVKKFVMNEYPHLCSGSRASGSGNVGPGNGSQRKISRAQFDTMSPVDKRRFAADGGAVFDT